MIEFSATGLNSENTLSRFEEEMPEVARLIRLEQAQNQYNVNGLGSTIAVLDSGVRASHAAFSGRIHKGIDFLGGTAQVPDEMTDRNGHGTHVAGIAAAKNWLNPAFDARNLAGVAPGASVFPLKVLRDNGRTNLTILEAAFAWLNEHAASSGISVVCMSITDERNHQSLPEFFQSSSIIRDIQGLADQNIPLVAAAGNFYNSFKSVEGMGFPAILSNVISVGSVFDENIGGMIYKDDDDAACTVSEADQLTPYTQRLGGEDDSTHKTIVFAPGGVVTSVGNKSDADIGDRDGTSQATPVVAGLVALMQQAYSAWYVEAEKSATAMTPKEIGAILRGGAVEITDADLGRDNVINTGKRFLRVDAVNSVRLAYQYGRQSVGSSQ